MKLIPTFRTSAGRLLAACLVVACVFCLGALNAAADCLTVTNITSWWPGNGTVNDVAGGRHATLRGGAGYATGLVGEAFSLNGNGQFVEVANDPALNFGTGDFTFELWVRFNTLAGEQVIMEKYVETYTLGSMGWSLTKLDDNTIRFGVGGCIVMDSAPASTVQPGNSWTHFAVRRSGTVFTMFQNGVPTGSANGACNTDSGASLKFGHRGNPTDTPGSADDREFWLNGSVDEPTLYVNHALSNQEIAAIYTAGAAGKCRGPSQNCTDIPPGLVAWWRAENNAQDALGNNHGVLQNGAVCNAGWVGQAFDLDGLGARIEIADSAALKPASVTVEAWVRFDTQDTPGASFPGLQYIVFKKNTRSSFFEGYALVKLRNAGIDRLYFFISSASGTQVGLVSTNAVVVGQWYHVAGTYDGSIARLYVDGVLHASQAASFPLDYGTRPVFIGSSGETTVGNLDGLVDEVAIYNRALTSNEVATVYSAGAAGKCHGPDTALGDDARRNFSTNSNPNGVWRYGWSDTMTGPLHLFTRAHLPPVNGNQSEMWDDPDFSLGWTPSVARHTGADYNNGNVTFLSGALILHPQGPTGQAYAHVIWTAPHAGEYLVSSSFFAQQNGINVDVRVLVNGVDVFSSTITQNGVSRSFTNVYLLASGDTVDFAVGPNGVHSLHPGNTGLEAVIERIESACGSVSSAFAGLNPVRWIPLEGNWENPANWSPARVPGAGDLAIICNGGTAVLNSPTNVGGLFVGYGNLTHNQGNTNGVSLFVITSIHIAGDGRLDVSGAGYLGGGKPGNVFGVSTENAGQTRGADGLPAWGSDHNSGGSYGSLGGGGYANPVYGSATAPLDLGSGGGGTREQHIKYGGNGGGRMHLRAASLVVDGALRANGEQAYHSETGELWDTGGGSGGSIFVELSGGSFSGSGVIEAKGGPSLNLGRFGGGGRIAVVGYASNSFAGTLGRAGTVFTQAASPGGHLQLDGTSLTIAADTTNTFSSFSATTNGGTIYNYGTLALAEDTLVVGAGVSLLQHGVVKGANRADDWIGSVTVQSNGVIWHAQGFTNGLQLKVAGPIQVLAGGRLDVSGAGYLGGSQPGNAFGTRGQTRGVDGLPAAGAGTASYTASGGSYGSLGGAYAPNPLYGSATAPVDLGSGGAGDSCCSRYGGNGGGRIHLRAQSLLMDGVLRANGERSYNGGTGATDGYGGGSGGSIFVELSGGSFSGSGVIEAKGGPSLDIGIGGGGRIAVVGYTSNSFAGTLGRAGTVFTQAASPGGHLQLDGTSLTIAADTTNTFSSFSATTNGGTIYNYGTLALAEDTLVVGAGVSLLQHGVVKGANRADDWIGSVTVQSNGVIWHAQGFTNGLQLKVAGPIQVLAGGRLDVSGAGYLGGSQPGNAFGTRGQTRGVDGLPAAGAGTASYTASGGSYGSLGGAYAPNPLYGSATAPVDLGSGGAGDSCCSRYGGNGGGRIHLRAQSLLVEGAVRANGERSYNGGTGATDGYGGGSGGSIFVELSGGSFSGSGVIEAKGGPSLGIGIGGGGRIAVVGYGTNAFSGTLGGQGTLYRNARPMLVSHQDLALCEPVSLNINNGATDSDPGDALTYTLLEAPAGASISASGVISWNSIIGAGRATNTFVTWVSDNGQSPMSVTNRFKVISGQVNPNLGFSLPTAMEGLPYSVNLVGAFCGTPTVFSLAGGTLPNGMSLSVAGQLQGIPWVAGAFPITIQASSAQNESAWIVLVLNVTASPPQFTRVPTGIELPYGGSLWLAAETRKPAQLQWLFNGNSLPDQTNGFLLVNNVSAIHAGSYRVRATDAIGSTLSPEAQVVVRQPVTPPEGVQITEGDFNVRSSGAIGLMVHTLPGRTYRVERAMDLAVVLAGGWRTVAEFVGDGGAHSFVDVEAQQNPSSFYRIVEQPVNPPAAWSLTDNTRFIGIAPGGAPQPGLLPYQNPTNGTFGPLELRPAGTDLPQGAGLIIRFPNGALPLDVNGGTVLRARDIDLLFGPDSFLQFAANPDGVHHIHSLTDLDVPVGPIDVRLLERLLGLPDNTGLEVVCFKAFHLKLQEGVFESDRIRNVRLGFLGRPDAPLPIALPALSSALGNVHLDLNSQRVRIPFHGEIPLPDGTGTPPTLRIPAERPLWLELRGDNTVAFGGSGELNFPNGPRFATEFSFDEPDYALRLAASRLEVPGLLGVVDLLPRPGVLSANADDTAMDEQETKLRLANSAAHSFGALTVGDATPDNAAAPDSPADEAGPSPRLQFWSSVAEHTLKQLTFPAAKAAVKHAARTAESSEDLAEIAAILEQAARLQFAGKDEAEFAPQVRGSVDRIIATTKRWFRAGDCTRAEAAKLLEACRLILQAETVLEGAGVARDMDLIGLATDHLSCSAVAYCQKLGVSPGVFTAPPDSKIGRMSRFEMFTPLKNLVSYRAQAQLMGASDPNLGAPIPEGISQLARALWAALEGKLNTAAAANDRRTVLLLASEAVELVSVVESGVLGDVSGLPTTAQLQEKLSQAFASGDDTLAAADIFGRRLDQLRDDFRRILSLLDKLPAAVNAPPPGLKRLHAKLADRLEQTVPLLDAQSVFDLPSMVAVLEGGLAHEEMRLRFNSGNPFWRTSEAKFTQVVTKLRERAVTSRSWTVLHQATTVVLEKAARARAFGLAAPPAAKEFWREFRRDCLREAGRLLDSAHAVNVALWNDAETRRNADPTLALAGMVLPGGFRIDEAAGEIRYNADTRRLRGAFTGKLVLPQVHGTFELLNGTFDTGGAFDVSAWGTVTIPGEGGMITLAVPQRRPFHLARALDGHVTIEGGVTANLRNGMSFEGYLSFNDPVYRLGASAGGLQFQMATNLAGVVQLPDLGSLAALPETSRAVAASYLARLGTTLDPLTSLAAAPEFEQIGDPPAFEESIIAVDVDPIKAAIDFMGLAVEHPDLFNLQSPGALAGQLSNIVSQVEVMLRRLAGTLAGSADSSGCGSVIDELQQHVDLFHEIQKLKELRAKPGTPVDVKAQLLTLITSLESQANQNLDAPLDELLADAAATQTILILQQEKCAKVVRECVEERVRARLNAHAASGDPAEFTEAELLWEAYARRRMTALRRSLGTSQVTWPDPVVIAQLGPEAVGEICHEITTLGSRSQEYGFDPLPLAELMQDTVSIQLAQARLDFQTIRNNPHWPHPVVGSYHAYMRGMALVARVREISQRAGGVPASEVDAFQAEVVAAGAPMLELVEYILSNNPPSPSPELHKAHVAWQTYVRDESRRKAFDHQKRWQDLKLDEMLAKLRKQATDDARRASHENLVSQIGKVVEAELQTLRPTLATMTLRAADAVSDLREALNFGRLLEETGWRTTGPNVHLALLGDFKLTVLPHITGQITAFADARKAWWMATRASEVLTEGLAEKAAADLTVMDHAALETATATLQASATMLGVVKNALRPLDHNFDLKLPGDLIVRRVYGDLTINTSTKLVKGCVGGRLEFPELGTGSWFDLTEFCLATDGSFSLKASGLFPMPGVDGATFEGTVTASGQIDPNDPLGGRLSFSGSGTVAKTGLNPVTVRLTYAQDGNGQWRIGWGLSGAPNAPIGEDFVLFDAALGFEVTGAGGAGVSVSAKAGIWRKDRTRPLSEQGELRPELFQIIVDDATVSVATENNVETTKVSGTLRLPADAFYAAEPGACGGTGPFITVPADDPISITHEAGVFRASASFTLGGFGARVSGVPIKAALCAATLTFPGDQPPYLANVSGTLWLPRPGDELIAINLIDGAFDLRGLPTGTIGLGTDVPLLDLGGFKLDLLGSAPIPNQPPATGLTVTQDLVTHRPIFTLFGSLRVTVPAEALTDTSATDGKLQSVISGSVKVEFPLDSPVRLTPHINNLCLEGLATLRLGAGGPAIQNPSLCLSNLANLFTPTEEHPFIVSLNGKLILPGGPGFGVSNANFTFYAPGTLPRFSLHSVSYEERDWNLVQGIPLRVTAATFGFVNEHAALNELFLPGNLSMRFSARLSLPTDDPMLAGEVNDVGVTFKPDGTPDVALDGFDLNLTTDKLPMAMLGDVTGRLRVGGLRSGNVWLAGKIGGTFQGYRLVYNAAFTPLGPLGVCLDVNFRDVGIPLDGYYVGGILLTGGRGGIAFVNTSDPCDFTTYFEVDPATGAYVLKSGRPLPPFTPWAAVRALAGQAQQRATNFANQFPKPNPPTVPVPAPRPVALGGGDAAKGPGGPQKMLFNESLCPGDCPPPTVNILCQPHPDLVHYPQRVIFKFTSIDEKTLNTEPPFGPGFTSNKVAQVWSQAGGSLEQFAATIATGITNFIVTYLPSAQAGDPTPTAAQASFANGQRALVLQMTYTAALNGVSNAVKGVSANQIYEQVREIAYAGLPCADISLALSGRFTYQPISYLGFMEGGASASTAGTLGVSGKFYLLGIPVGDARVFLAFTDAEGEPNPSACGAMNVMLGPLNLGDVQLAMGCPGCVTGFLQAFPKVARILGEPLLRDVLSRAVPGENFNGLSTEDMIKKLLTLTPPERRAPAIGAFFATLPTTDPQKLPGNLGDLLRDALQDTWDSAQPYLIFCGAVDPRLFGFPLPLLTGETRVTGLITKTNLAASFSTSPSIAFSSLFARTLPPLGDLATFGVNLPVPDPISMFLASLDGTLESPERLASFLRQQANGAMNQLTTTINYEWHPFGLPVADAAVRLILPDVLDHPSLRVTPWASPELRGQNLPSRQEVLVAGANSGLLGRAGVWFGTASDIGDIFPAGDPRRNLVYAAGVELRKDYFPNGGLVGGAQLALPKMLQESPGDWLPLLNSLGSNPDIIQRFTSAMQLLNEHILKLNTNGTISFYLPAPNPPRLTEMARTNGPAAARNLMHTLEASQLIDDLRGFNPTNVVNPDLYPFGAAFFEGRLNGSFLGVPMAAASIRAEVRPTATPTNALPPGTTIGELRFSAPRDSWIGKLSGNPIDFRWAIQGAPPLDLKSYFTDLAARLQAATNGPNSAAQIQAVVDELRASLGTQLPKFAFSTNLPEVTIYSPVDWAGVTFSGDEKGPGFIGSGPAVLKASLSLHAFSPGFAPETVGDDPEAQARRLGGFAARGSLEFFPDVPAWKFGVGQAAFAITPAEGGGKSGPVPHVVGELANISVPPLFPGFLFDNTSATFDNLAEKFLRLHKEFAAPPLAVVTASAMPGDPNGMIDADLEFQRVAPEGSLPFLTASLAVDPLLLGLPLVQPGLALHGAGGPNARLVLSPDHLSAAGELRDAGGALATVLELRAPAGLPGAPTGPLLRVSNLPSAGFTVEGRNLSDFTATAHADLASAVQLTLLPEISIPNPFNPLDPNLTLPTMTLVGNGTFALSVKSDGTFALRGELSGAVGPFAAGASVTVDNTSAQIIGQINGAQGTLNVNLLTQTATFSGSVSLLGPLCAFNNRICLRGNQPDGRISFTMTPDGLCAEGAVLTLKNFSPDGEDVVVTLPPFCLGPNDVFTALQPTVRPGGAKLGPFELTGLDQFQVSGDFRQGRLSVQLGGNISVAGIFDAGFDARLDQDGFDLGSRDNNLRVLGFDFASASLHASGNASGLDSFTLDFSGQLTLPFATFTLTGTIPRNGAFALQPTVTLNSVNAAPNFPLKDVLPKLKYEPTDYSQTVQGDQPAGYWRLAETSGSSAFGSPGAKATYRSSVTRGVEGIFGGNGNPAVEFLDGAGGYVTVPPAANSPTSTGFTVELWFRRNSDGDICPLAACNQTLAGQSGAWALQLIGQSAPPGFSPPVRLSWSIAGLTPAAPALLSGSLFRNTDWHHVVATWDGLIQALYVDGRLEAWQSVRGTPATSAELIGLGALPNSGGADNYFSGRLDEPAIYPRALSPVEVADHWAAAGRGALRLEGKFNFFGLDTHTTFQGLLDQNGGWAVELATSTPFGFDGLNTPGLNPANGRVTLLHRPSGGGDIVSVTGQAQLPGFLGSVVSQRLRAVTTSPNDFLFQVEHNGQLPNNIPLPFYLQNLRAERVGGGAITARLEGRLNLPHSLGELSIAGDFGGNSFTLQNTSAFTAVAGAARFNIAPNALVFGPNVIHAGGSLQIVNNGNAVANLNGSLNWTPSAFQLTAAGDTGWQEILGSQTVGVCPLCYTTDVTLAHKRLKWNLGVEREGSNWKLAIGGEFYATVDACAKPNDPISFQNFPRYCNQAIQPLSIELNSSGTVNSDGTMTVNAALNGLSSFTFDLW